MSYPLSAQKDMHVDSKKDMHVDNSDLFLQIDKRLSEVTGLYREKSSSAYIILVSSASIFVGEWLQTQGHFWA